MDKNKLYKLRDMLMDEIGKSGDVNELSYSCLEAIKKCGECYEIVDKMIRTYDGYSPEYQEGMPYRMPRIPRQVNNDWQSPNYGERYYGYGHDISVADHMRVIDQLETMMNEAKSEKERKILMTALEGLKSM